MTLSNLHPLIAISQQTAMVIETNNLRGGTGGMKAVVRSLERLFALLNAQSFSLKNLYEVIVTHDGIEPSECERLSQGQDYTLRFELLIPDTGYYNAKNAGFAATSPNCRYIVFADSDCIPDSQWLVQMLQPLLENPDLPVVAGRTSYRPSLLGAALSTIDFKYYPNPRYANATRNFYANNVVFNREVFAQFAYQPLQKTYRGHCQVFGLRLEQSGVEMRFVSAAHTVHRIPDSLGEILQLRWMRGQDACSLTPFLVRRHLPDSMQWFARTGPIAPLIVLFFRLIFSFGVLNHQDLPPQKGLRRLAAYGLILAISSIDMVGALARGLGWSTLDRPDADNVALSYHH
jgi:cellulose synthase/poly-beta-1,6-N-acetylglucosamine synthase-like glycosyltransferase